MSWIFVYFLLLFLLEFVRVTLIHVDFPSLLFWCVLLQVNTRVGLWLAFLTGVVVSLVGGDMLGLTSLLYLSWWLLLSIYRRKYDIDHLFFLVISTLVAAISVSYFRSVTSDWFEVLIWVFVVLFENWLILRFRKTGDISLRY